MKYVKTEENGYSDLHGVHFLSGGDVAKPHLPSCLFSFPRKDEVCKS